MPQAVTSLILAVGPITAVVLDHLMLLDNRIGFTSKYQNVGLRKYEFIVSDTFCAITLTVVPITAVALGHMMLFVNRI